VNEDLFLRFAATDVEGFLKRHHIPPKAKLVSFLGTLEERKNPSSVLKVAELLKDRSDIHFLIAGRGGTVYAEKLKEKARNLPNVTYLGEINDKEKILLIKSSFANILMSQVEALGLTQMEFMYAGVPVVTSAVGGQSWLVRNGREGIHVEGPDDEAGATKAIETLADDGEFWSKLSANAKERVRNLTSNEVMRELDDAITEEMIKESGLKEIPQEALMTLAEPEHVLKTWSAGSWGAIATDRRLFVKHGRLSRKVTEIPYSSIAYIEHTRRYPWKFLVAGLVPGLLVVLEPLWRSILKTSFVSTIEGLISPVAEGLPFVSPQTITILFALIPYLIGLAVFAIQARIGINLYGLGRKPVYLPHGFREVVAFIRKMQDRQQDVAQLEGLEPRP
jgi:roadblock/LC7 domain-containing protein